MNAPLPPVFSHFRKVTLHMTFLEQRGSDEASLRDAVKP